METNILNIRHIAEVTFARSSNWDLTVHAPDLLLRYVIALHTFELFQIDSSLCLMSPVIAKLHIANMLSVLKTLLLNARLSSYCVV